MPDPIIIVSRGRFQGLDFRLEGDVRDIRGGGRSGDLSTLASEGNWAARNALSIDGYKVEDAPFYYGKIGTLGYIISHNDLYGTK